MTRDRAALYLAAARSNPFLAAWVGVLDEHAMHYRTEVAPPDWEAAFEELFNLGFVSEDQFNRVDFKREFRRKPPPARDIEAALSSLAAMRCEQEIEENDMSKFDLFEKGDALTVTQKGNLAKHDGFQPICRRESAPREIISTPTRNEVLAPLEPTRRVLDSATSSSRRALSSGDGKDFPADPRSYVEEFNLKLYCCGEPVELVYDDGRDATEEFQGTTRMLIEFIFHAVCPHCNGEHYHSIVRPMPADYMPR